MMSRSRSSTPICPFCSLVWSWWFGKIALPQIDNLFVSFHITFPFFLLPLTNSKIVLAVMVLCFFKLFYISPTRVDCSTHSAPVPDCHMLRCICVRVLILSLGYNLFEGRAVPIVGTQQSMFNDRI